MKLLLIGGENAPFAHAKDTWARHRAGIAAVLDTETGELTKILEYTGSSKYLPNDGAITFKAATLLPNRALLCTTVEVLEFELPSWRLVRSVTHPWFNDVHHVVETRDGNLLVANTGLDMIMEIMWSGECINHWFVGESEGWGRFNKNLDYRLIPSTKPHEAHPNFITLTNDGFFATRFQQRDAINPASGARIEIEIGFPHDGIVDGQSVWYTTVNGFVSCFSLEKMALEWRGDLNQHSPANVALGWCRGISILNSELVAIGFSRLRPTKFRENLQWLSHKLSLTKNSGVLPTRVVLFDRSKGAVVREFDVEPIGMNAIFSIHVLT